MPVTRSLSFLTCAIVVLCLAMSFNTASAQTAARGRAHGNDSVTVQVAGQTVAIDRETGRLRQPTPEEAKALAAGLKAMLNRSTEGLTVVQHANGAKSVDLQGRFQSISVAKVNSEGKVAERCVTNQREAAAFVSGAAKSTRKTSHGAVPKAIPGKGENR
jgi:hypothetical protein